VQNIEVAKILEIMQMIFFGNVEC